jgi:hypothetical protein
VRSTRALEHGDFFIYHIASCAYKRMLGSSQALGSSGVRFPGTVVHLVHRTRTELACRLNPAAIKNDNVRLVVVKSVS